MAPNRIVTKQSMMRALSASTQLGRVIDFGWADF